MKAWEILLLIWKMLWKESQQVLLAHFENGEQPYTMLEEI